VQPKVSTMDHVVLSEGQPVLHSHLLVRESTARRSEALKPLVVLVAPDPQCAQALRLVLGRQYRLKEYASGEQAWASLQIDGNAAALICSSSLPRMSGLELIAKLRKARLPMLRQIPLCLIANTLDEDLRNRLAPAPAAGAAPPSRPTRADELRRWAHQHGLLEEHRRASLVIFRVVSEGVGVLGDRLGRIIRRPRPGADDGELCLSSGARGPDLRCAAVAGGCGAAPEAHADCDSSLEIRHPV
jgi:CheY-like chemotaxis protein